MKSTNIGIANLVVSNKLKDSYFNNSMIDESKKLTTDFFSVVKSSPILQLEFKIFNALENKTIENEVVATRYIDNNIKLFEVYTISEIEAERGKMNQFLIENFAFELVPDSDKLALYEAIDTLITESLNDYDKVDVDNIHESFEIVLNHVKTPKKQALTESKETEFVDSNVIEIAINRFNEKYDSLNEDDRNLLKKLMKSNDREKLGLFEEYKTECLAILEGVKKDSIEEKILKTIQKIKEMKHNSMTLDDDIIGLHELKRGLL